MNQNRKQWNEGQQKLNRALKSNDIQNAVKLFLIQHAMVHSAKMSRSRLWSLEDECLEGLTEAEIRCIPPNGEHSIAWILWHIARIEDITMNMLIAGTAQIFVQNNWSKNLKATIGHSGNKMNRGQIADLSAAIDIASLRDYRLAVGHRTREIVKKLHVEQLKQKVDPMRLQEILKEGAVIEEAMEIVNYWSRRTIAGLLLMPPTRHNFLHLNEALQIRGKVSHV